MKFDPSSAVPEQEFDPTTAVPEEAPPVRAVLRNAVKVNPDQAARAATLGKERGLPADVVLRNLADVELQAAVDAADERLKTSPKLAAAMRKRPDIAPMAHDDLGPLSEVEAAVRKHGELKAWNGPAPTLKNIALGLAKAVPQASGAIKAGLDAQMTDFLEWVGLIALDPIVKADRARKLAQASGAADFTRPDFESSTGRAIYGGVESTLRMIPGLIGSIATRSPTPMLAAAGVQSQAEAYGKYSVRGATGGEAFLGATGEAVVEVATELIPAGFLTEKLGRAGVGEFVTGLLAREIPGEQIATLLQDAIDTAVANPDKTWGEYLAERPEAAYETLVSTLTQSALMGGVHTAARRLAQMGDQGQQANEASDALAEAMKTAGAAALRERSPEQFRALMGEMTDGKVYVDGEVLNQLPEDVKASLPQAVQDQIATAAATGDVVEISTADVLTIAPGTALEEVLVEHARTDPFAMSKADAAEATKLAQSSVLTDAQRIIQQGQDADARRAEYDAIHKLYVDQLNAAARFRPAVNEAKAHWLASFYTTMAARTGMTPAGFQAAHPVSILGAPSATTAGPVMDQGKPGEVSVEGYHFSTADRPVLTTGAFGTGLRGSARDEIMAHPDARLKQRLSFYVDLGKGIVPESGVGGRAHRAQLTNVYDSDLDPLKLRSGNARDFEVKLLDAGYSGYLTRMGGASQGQVIMLGAQTVQPELLGPQARITAGQRVAALPSTGPKWENYATGTPEEMQAQMERMRAKSSWQAYDMRVEGNALQYRKKEAVLEQSVTLRKGDETLAAYGLPPGGKYNTRDIAAALEARQREKWGKIEPDDRSPEAADKIAQWMAEEVRFEMLHPRKSGVGWYSYKFQRALDTFAEVFPELKKDKDARSILTALIAITSDGQKVVPNFRMAVDLYANFRKGGATEGKFTTSRGHARMDSIDGNVALLQKMLEDMGPKAARKYLLQEATVSELRKRAKAEGVDFKTDYQAHVKLPMAAVTFGPKLGAFYANLMGAHGYLTMDRWWSRTFNRYRGTLLPSPTVQGVARFKELLGKPEMSDDEALAATVAYQASYEKKGFKNGTEIEKAANTLHKAAFTTIEDAPFNATDRTFMLSAVDKAQQILDAEGRKISVADIQAVLWYYEKRLYGELGARQTADVSYEDAAKTVAAEQSGATGRPDAPGAGEGAGQDDTGAAAGVPEADVGLEPFQSSGTLTQDGGLTDGQTGNRAGRYSSGSLAPLAGAPTVAGAAGPDARLVAVAEQYAADNGIVLRRQAAYATVDPERAARIAAAYEAMPHAPNDPAVREAYDNLAQQTLAQYLALQQAGYQFYLVDETNDPYAGNPWNAMRDLRANQTMGVFATEAGFGTSEFDPAGNPLLTLKDEKILDDFLVGLTTPAERHAMRQRLEIVIRLLDGQPQHKIASDLGVGVATVTRGSKELHAGRFKILREQYEKN